ncbi:PAS domain-containing sensor histidine kinase [Hymenobacter algoricola]|uniref:histidine kinase n=1 Tax=Hymenobacter algoricola TaxID=486267 RepID=A0ABP7NAQ8_9BACT
MSDYLPLFRPLIENSNVIYFAYDLAGRRVAHVSQQAYEQLFGDPAAHVNDDLPHWLTRLHPDDWHYLHQRVEQAGPAELVQDVELRVTQADGSPGWLCATVYCTQPAGGPQYLCGSLRDISAAKAATLNAQKFNIKKDSTLEILSHDLAAPLILVQQLADLLTHEADGRLTERMRHLLGLMERTCQDGISLIRDFVDNEFLESANVDYKPERADLVAWLRLLMTEFQNSEWHTHLHFDFGAPEQPLYVCFDINKFQQVINNLVSNAIKFTPDGGRITVGVARHGNAARISVADTGVGIPAQYQAELFEKFTRARRPGLRGEKTTGLGMSIIKTIMELHQGRIWFDSAEGTGTTFYLELPALPA